MSDILQKRIGLDLSQVDVRRIGENVQSVEIGQFLVLVIDRSAQTHPNQEGNFDILATTHGWTRTRGGTLVRLSAGKNRRTDQ